jgi:hypothetical protein
VPLAHTLNDWHSAPRLWWLRGIVLSTVVVTCALVPRLWLHGVLEDRSTFILFTLAVVCVCFGGVFAGAVATGLSIVAGIVVFLGPAHDETERLADIIENRFICRCMAGNYLAGSATSHGPLRAEDALEQVRTLTGLLPICAWCKKIRDEEGRWQQLERYLSLHSDARFTHGLCEECGRRIEADGHALKGA